MKKLFFIILSAIALSGCGNVGGSLLIRSQPDGYYHDAPPAHAPAYGRRDHDRMHRYYYYPDAYVYFSPVRHMYFYLSNNEWRMSASLPNRLRVELGEHVDVETASDKPYTEYSKHRRMYKGKKYKRERGYEKHGKRKMHGDRDDRDD
jgi:hypothetical protein